MATGGLMVWWSCFCGVEVERLPDWELADTEVSTNVPLALPPANVKHFQLSLELAGTPSNNVQVAFGRDVNANGVLEIGETDTVFGWDCGEWRARRAPGGPEWMAEAATTNRVKVLDVNLYVTRGRGKQLSCTENGEELDWSESQELSWAMYDKSWDTLRLTVRGVDRADASLRAAVRVAGMKIIIR